MEKIQMNIILEILGRPKEHIVQSLNELIVRLSNEKGVVVKQKTVHEPVSVEGSKDIFTTFAEINLEVDSILEYFAVIFGYMPANIETSYPERLTLKNDELNMVANRLLQRLHDYDSVVKKTLFDKDRLIEKLREHAPELFVKSPQQESKKEAEKQEKPKKKKKAKKSKN